MKPTMLGYVLIVAVAALAMLWLFGVTRAMISAPMNQIIPLQSLR
jgi:hypothetical protein